MLKNYFLVAWRGLLKNRVFSAINVLGLAIGLAVCMLIALYVTHELSYDRYNVKADRIYRLNFDSRLGDARFYDASTAAPVGPALVKDFPEVEAEARINYIGNMLVRKGDQTLLEDHAAWADPGVFEVFTLPMVAGSPKTALAEPNTMVISEKMAKKYFGDAANAVGKTMVTDNSATFRVTGVIKDMPEASHIHLDFIRSICTYLNGTSPEWLNNNLSTYVLLRPGVKEAQLGKDLRQVVLRYLQPTLQAYIHSSIADLEKKGDYVRLTTIPLTRIHLYSDITDEVEPGGNIEYVYIFIAAGILILLLACVNFMNLSTSRSAGRSMEVGVRKVMGSSRGQLVWQFLVESFLTSVLALALGFALATIALPYLSAMAGTALSWAELPWVWLGPALIGLMVLVGVVAGSYPAFYLSAFKPVKVLKGKLAMGFRGTWMRNTLVTFQFTTAVILIIGTLTIYSQLWYIQNRKLGYNREQVAVISNMGSLSAHARAFEAEVSKMPGVVSATMASVFPTSTNWNTFTFSRDAGMAASQSLTMGQWNVDADYIPTLGMEMAAGRNFSPEMPTDSGAIVINETAARMLGFTDPLKHNLYAPGNTAGQVISLPIIGVVKDFSTGSMRNKVPPIIFRLANQVDKMAVRVRTGNLPRLMTMIENEYHAIFPAMAGQPFTYTFMDEDFNRLYAAEQRTGKLFVSFAVFAILIACLGLFGLVRFAAEQRTREIGIRKVLGASESGLVGLLSKDLLKLVVVAVVLATPLAWWMAHWWLQGFAYRVPLSGWLFVMAGLAAVGIALATVGMQALKAARANPVKCLRDQ